MPTQAQSSLAVTTSQGFGKRGADGTNTAEISPERNVELIDDSKKTSTFEILKKIREK